MKSRLRIACTLILLVLHTVGCSQLPILRFLPAEETPTSLPLPTTTSSPVPTVNITQAPVRPVALRVWLPPEFNPEKNNEAGKMIRQRLDEFSQRRDVRIDIRIKALDDSEGGMVNTLITAGAAAPLALPDVALMTRPVLENATSKSLIYAFDEYVSPLNDPDWYDYARQLVTLQGNTFGIPFAADAQVMLYRSNLTSKPPRTWEAVLATKFPLLYPVGDPQALFTTTQILSSGGSLQDTDNHPAFDLTTLTKVFTFYEQAQKGQQMPFWITQYENDEQSYQAFLDNRSPLVITWVSRFLKEPPKDTAVSLVPTESGSSYSLVTGWNWTLTSPDPTRRAMAAELVKFLTLKEFTTLWTEKAGYLPTQKSALIDWKNEEARLLADTIITAAHLPPSIEILNVISPILKDASIQVLKNQSNATKAAQYAIDKLKTP
ncbi:MAG: extracellular solute-binding protein [Chloroflexota bacterium]